MKKYGLVGFPLSHSLSPRIHRAIYDACLIDASYELIEIKPEKLSASREILTGFDGFNVTIPHKVDIIPLLDKIDRADSVYGSVNTVKNDRGVLTGFNTDAGGFSDALRIYDIPQDGAFILYGAGGAARAAAVSILQMGGKLTIAARDIDKGQRMADEIRENLCKRELKCHLFETKRAKAAAEAAIPPVEVVPYEHIGQYDTVVNATPAGMNPSHADECIVPGEVIDACSNVFDMVYNPRDTLLVKQARQSGKNARSGMAMLVYQAVAAVDIWEELDDRFDDDMIMDLIRAFEKEFDN